MAAPAVPSSSGLMQIDVSGSVPHDFPSVHVNPLALHDGDSSPNFPPLEKSPDQAGPSTGMKANQTSHDRPATPQRVSAISEAPRAWQGSDSVQRVSRVSFSDWIRKDISCSARSARLDAALKILSSASKDELSSILEVLKAKQHQLASELPPDDVFYQADCSSYITASGVPLVEINHESHVKCAENLATHSVIGYYTGGFLDFRRLMRWLPQHLSRLGLPAYESLKKLGKNFFLIMFNTADAVEKLVSRGVDPMGTGYLLYQYYTPGFSPGMVSALKMPCWFSIPDLPVDMLVHEFLVSIANGLGMHISHSIVNGPRICVSLPIDHSIPDCVVVKSGNYYKKLTLTLLNGPELASMFPNNRAFSSAVPPSHARSSTSPPSNVQSLKTPPVAASTVLPSNVSSPSGTLSVSTSSMISTSVTTSPIVASSVVSTLLSSPPVSVSPLESSLPEAFSMPLLSDEASRTIVPFTAPVAATCVQDSVAPDRAVLASQAMEESHFAQMEAPLASSALVPFAFNAVGQVKDHSDGWKQVSLKKAARQKRSPAVHIGDLESEVYFAHRII